MKIEVGSDTLEFVVNGEVWFIRDGGDGLEVSNDKENWYLIYYNEDGIYLEKLIESVY